MQASISTLVRPILLRSMESAAKEARFEVTEEFARDAYRGLEDLKERVDREVEGLRCVGADTSTLIRTSSFSSHLSRGDSQERD